MNRFLAIFYILFKGTEKLVSKENEVKSSYVKETEKFRHEDIEGVDVNDLDMDSFQTVSFPSGHKLVTAKNKKTNERQGIRFLIPVEKKKK